VTKRASNITLLCVVRSEGDRNRHTNRTLGSRGKEMEAGVGVGGRAGTGVGGRRGLGEEKGVGERGTEGTETAEIRALASECVKADLT
jgi:hypothetical protein